MAGGLLQQPADGPPAAQSLEQQAHQAAWADLTPQLRAHVAGLFDGKQRLFVRMFAFDSGLCVRQPWSEMQHPLQACCWHARPSAVDVVAYVRRFLGLFMINRFDLLNFLEDAGLWAEPGSERRPLADSYQEDEEDDWDEEDEDGDVAERKYAPATFEASGLAVAGLLELLASGGFYEAEALAPALKVAQQAAIELPRCALLGVYLPGPLNIVKDLLLGKSGADDQQPCLDEMEEGLAAKYTHIAPRFNFRRAAAAVLATESRVEASQQRRMRVVGVANRHRVTFVDASAPSHPSARDVDEAGHCVEIEMDPEIGSLLLPGMTVTGVFSRLSDGSWLFSQPSYCWPSYYHNARARGGGTPADADGSLSEPETSDDEDAGEYDDY